MNEKYIPLYRKYRPQKLEEIVGQAHIKKALANAISMGRISHAYLFTGPRGTGKTSTARIFAKSLNCKDGPTITPCGECENCRDITNSVPMDVIEIDAASNRKVEDAQNILEKVMYAPVNSRYKIYIIDEVHMLSNTAFNALLKTLEEPPKNVIFILATTEVHKVLDTIKSRCQRFDFKRITTDDIVKHLRYISDCEKINITDEALFTIAKNSAGGMRDSIALLDQLSILDGENAISTDDINNLLGRISFDVLRELAQNIVNSNAQGAIEVLENIYNSGNEPSQILENLLGYFKNLLIVKNCKPEIIFELTQLNEAQIKELKTQGENLETHQITFLIEKTSNYVKEVKAATNARLWLEVGVIDLANLTENTKLMDLQERLTRLESGAPQHSETRYAAPPAPQRSVSEIQNEIKARFSQSTSKPEPVQSVAPPPPPKPVPQPTPQNKISSPSQSDEFSPMPKAKPSSDSDTATLWGMVLGNISSVPTRALLKQWGNPIKVTPEETIFTMKNEVLMQQFTSGNKRQIIADALDTLFSQENSKFTVRLPQAGDEVVKPVTSASVPTPQAARPIKPQVSPQPQSAAPKPAQTKVEEEVDPTIEENLMAARATAGDISSSQTDSETPREKKPSELSLGHSDQVNMVMDLFDGKIIE